MVGIQCGGLNGIGAAFGVRGGANIQFAPTSCGVGIVVQNKKHVDVVGHDDEFVNLEVRETLWQSLEFVVHHLPCWVELHAVARDIAKPVQRSSLGANGHKVRAIARVIVRCYPDAATLLLELLVHNPACASSTARRKARAFEMLSSYSKVGLESATTPPAA